MELQVAQRQENVQQRNITVWFFILYIFPMASINSHCWRNDIELDGSLVRLFLMSLCRVKVESRCLLKFASDVSVQFNQFQQHLVWKIISLMWKKKDIFCLTTASRNFPAITSSSSLPHHKEWWANEGSKAT